MKNTIAKIFLSISILIILIVISFLGYTSYSMYKSYTIAKNANNYIADIKHINQTIEQIEVERVQSSLYLGYDGKVEFKNLQDSRIATDKLVKQPNISDALQYVRSRVDVISSNYKDILFDYYQDEIIENYIHTLKEKIDELSFGIDSLKESLTNYYNSVLKRDNLNKERSLLTLILSSSKKMSNDDLILWNDILKQKDIQEQNVKIARGVVDGNYQLDINQWFQDATKKESHLIASQEELLKDIKSKIVYTKNYPDTLKYLLIALLFLLFVLTMLIKMFKKQTKTKTIIHNKYIVRKHPRDEDNKKDIDMPLSNIRAQKALDSYDDYPEARTFNPMEEFLLSTKHFIDRSKKKKITFNYFIDPTLPTLCIGEIEKIQKALDYLVNYVIAVSKTRDTIKFNIENIASTKFESAIRFSIEDEHSHFSKEEKKQILSIMLTSKKDEAVNFDDIRDDLIYINELVHNIGGVFKIENKPPKGAIYHITINFLTQH